MSFYSNADVQARPGVASLDISAIMRLVYVWMTIGLAVSGGVAYLFSHSLTLERAYYENPFLPIITIIVYLGLAFTLQPIVMRAPLAVGMLAFIAIAAVLGVMLSSIFLVYATSTIFEAFIATAGTFAAMSLIGYFTRVDLSRFGSLFMMAIIGLLVASVVNIFLASSALYWLINYAGVLIFTALIAYDTQWIKNLAGRVAMGTATVSSNGEMAIADTGVQRVALIGAFHLYIDFVNLFMFILRIMGGGGGGRRR